MPKLVNIAPSADTPIVVRGSFPPVQRAISIAGDGGSRLQLDIPESDIDEVKRLFAFRGRELYITFQPVPEPGQLAGVDVVPADDDVYY